MIFYGPHITRTLTAAWTWHAHLARLPAKPFETAFEPFAHFLPIALHDPAMRRVFSEVAAEMMSPPRLTEAGQTVFANYHTFAAMVADNPLRKTKRVVAQAEKAEQAIKAWVSQRLIYFSRFVSVVDEIDLWWIALCGTSHYAGLYEQPSLSFVTYVRQNVGFVDKPPRPAGPTGGRRKLG